MLASVYTTLASVYFCTNRRISVMIEEILWGIRPWSRLRWLLSLTIRMPRHVNTRELRGRGDLPVTIPTCLHPQLSLSLSLSWLVGYRLVATRWWNETRQALSTWKTESRVHIDAPKTHTQIHRKRLKCKMQSKVLQFTPMTGGIQGWYIVVQTGSCGCLERSMSGCYETIEVWGCKHSLSPSCSQNLCQPPRSPLSLFHMQWCSYPVYLTPRTLPHSNNPLKISYNLHLKRLLQYKTLAAVVIN